MDDGVRFGELYEAGVKIRLADNIGLSTTYSENLIMPRFMFWYWSLGKIIEGTSQGLADFFINDFGFWGQLFVFVFISILIMFVVYMNLDNFKKWLKF